MKNIFFFLLAGFLVISCKTTQEVEEVAEEPIEVRPTAPQKRDSAPRRGGVDGEQLAAQLGLTVEQEGPFIEMWDRTTKEMQQVRIENRGDREALISEMKAVKAKRIEALEDILTENQMNLYYEIMQANRGKARGKLHKRKG